MPKYRLLTQEELIQLEKVFVNFLAANSIIAQDWEKIKAEDKTRMDSLIEEFSDVVFEKTLSNVKLLEKRLENKILMYTFDENQISLNGIEVTGNLDIDFRKEFNVADLYKLFENQDLKISFIVGNKPYFEDIKKEIFDLIESGAMISQNNSLLDILIKLKAEYAEE